MRVLWFTNTPSLARTILDDNSVSGGWISSLEKQIVAITGIQLGIAFHYGVDSIRQYTVNDNIYYAIPHSEAKGKLKRLWQRWTHQIESKSAIDDYLQIVEEFKPDIIHVFGTEQAFGLITGKINIPVVIQIQGILSVILYKWFSGISKYDILRYSDKSLFIRAYSIWHEYFVLRRRSERELKIFKECKYIIGRTEFDRLVTSSLSYGSNYYHCDEIMRSEFYSHQWKPLYSQKIIIFSTLGPSVYKGLEVVLQTASMLKKESKLDFEWIIAGISHNDEIVSITEKSIGGKLDQNNVSLIGSLDVKSLIDKLLESNLYVHPSHIENSPNSICEAMLLGMPIIATHAGGTASLINNKIEGILIQDGDPFVLFGAILDLLKNRYFASEIGKNANKIAIQRHDPEKIVQALLKIYDQILST